MSECQECRKQHPTPAQQLKGKVAALHAEVSIQEIKRRDRPGDAIQKSGAHVGAHVSINIDGGCLSVNQTRGHNIVVWCVHAWRGAMCACVLGGWMDGCVFELSTKISTSFEQQR